MHRPLALVVLMCAAGAAFAQAPPTPIVIQHHGRLLDGTDTPIDGSVDLAFKIYDTYDPLQNHEPIWDESYTVTAVKGIYTATLGDTLGPNANKSPLAAGMFNGAERWLAIAVGGGPELSPRLRIGSVAFAFRAASAARADLADTVAAGAVGTAEIGAGAVTLGKLALTDGKLVGLNADALDGLDASAFAPASIETKIDTIDTNVDTANATLATLDGEVDAANASLLALDGEVDGLTIGAASILADTTTLKSDTATLKSDTGTLKSDTTTLKTDTGTLKTAATSIESKVDTLTTKVNTLDTKVSDLSKRWGTYSKSCTDAVAKGWNSIADCQTDGRWHFYFNAGGNALTNAGTGAGIDQFYEASRQGADTKMRMGEDWYDIAVRYQNNSGGFWVFLRDRNPLFSFIVYSDGHIDNIHVHTSNAYTFDDAWWNNSTDFGNRHHAQSAYSYRGARSTAFPLNGIDFWAKY